MLSKRVVVRVIKTVSKRGTRYRCGRLEDAMQVCAEGQKDGQRESRYFDRYWRAVNVPGE